MGINTTHEDLLWLYNSHRMVSPNSDLVVLKDWNGTVLRGPIAELDPTKSFKLEIPSLFLVGAANEVISHMSVPHHAMLQDAQKRGGYGLQVFEDNKWRGIRAEHAGWYEDEAYRLLDKNGNVVGALNSIPRHERLGRWLTKLACFSADFLQLSRRVGKDWEVIPYGSDLLATETYKLTVTGKGDLAISEGRVDCKQKNPHAHIMEAYARLKDNAVVEARNTDGSWTKTPSPNWLTWVAYRLITAGGNVVLSVGWSGAEEVEEKPKSDHPHAGLQKVYEENPGAVVQRLVHGTWKDMPFPSWDASAEYRVVVSSTPKPIIDRWLKLKSPTRVLLAKSPEKDAGWSAVNGDAYRHLPRNTVFAIAEISEMEC